MSFLTGQMLIRKFGFWQFFLQRYTREAHLVSRVDSATGAEWGGRRLPERLNSHSGTRQEKISKPKNRENPA
jgi:hypothetical protein